MLLDLLTLTAWLSLIIALRYLAVAGAAHWLFWGQGADRGTGRSQILNRTPPRPEVMRREILASLISSPIYAFPAAAAYYAFQHGHTRLYLDPRAYGLWWLPASALIYLLAQDAYYYWLHRAMHHRLMFAWSHRGHHRSLDPSPFASFSFDPAEAALTAWFLPALTLLIPLQLGVALGLLTLMTLAAVFNHAGREVWPERWLTSPIGRWIITARHHDGHHKSFRSNYGLYLRVWDKLAGTDRG